MSRITAINIRNYKNSGNKFAMVTAYDYTSARLAEAANLPILLVGDSLGMVVMGYESTIPVTMDDMVRHTQMVVRGSKKAHIVSDLPFMTYQESPSIALHNAGRLIQEGGAQSVKMEGGENIAEAISNIASNGIPVMGHLGLTPQYVNALTGYQLQAKTQATASALINDALAVEAAGAYAVVLELIPKDLANIITSKLSIPTIGIGAGPECDGQVQVFHDILGLYSDFVPKHTKQYCDLRSVAIAALEEYSSEVSDGIFPSSNNSFSMPPSEIPVD